MTSQFLPVHSLGKDLDRGVSSVFSADGDVLEISIDRTKVSWRSETKQLTRLSITPSKSFGPVLGAVWATFKSGGRSICILQSEVVVIHAIDGPSHEVALPCKADSIWAIPRGGVLIQRAVAGTAAAPAAPIPDNAGAVDPVEIPILFSILHPLDEPFPLCLPDGDFVTGTEDRVVLAVEGSPLLVTYNQALSKCRVWTIGSHLPTPPGVARDVAAAVGDDDDTASAQEDDDVEAQVVLEPLWEKELPVVTDAFLVSNGPPNGEKPSTFLYLKAEGAAEAYLVEGGVDSLEGSAQNIRLTFSFSIPCSSAAPIACGGATYVLTTPRDRIGKRLLHLHSGSTMVCTFLGTGLGAAEGEPETFTSKRRGDDGNRIRPGGEAAIARLSGAVDDRVDLTLDDGSVYRVQIPFSTESGLAKRCLDALSGVLPRPLWLGLHTEVLVRCDDHWKSFVNIVSEVFVGHERESSGRRSRGGSLEGGASNDAGESANPGDAETTVSLSPSSAPSKSAWREMMASGFHDNYDTTNKAQPRCFAKEPLPGGSKRRRSVQSGRSGWVWPEQDTETTDAGMGTIAGEFRVPYRTADFLPHVPLVFAALHAIYEDIKLSVLSWPELDRLAPLLTRCASLIGAKQYETYYAGDVSLTAETFQERSKLGSVADEMLPGKLPGSSSPPNVYAWLTNVFRQGLGTSSENCRDDIAPFPPLRFLPKDTLTSKLCCVYTALHKGRGVAGNRLAIEEMVKHGISNAILEVLPIGVSLPLQEAAAQCRDNPPEGWSNEAYSLIGRGDLVEFEASLASAKAHSTSTNCHPIANDSSGLELVQSLTRLRFGRDRRMHEVCRLLRSHKPVRLVVERGPELSDHDLVMAQQTRLEQYCRRTLSLPVGRGMLTLSTLAPESLTEVMVVPEMSLHGRVPPSNGAVVLDKTMLHLPQNYADWVNFHNGVAAGLRIDGEQQKKMGSTPPAAQPQKGFHRTLTRNWILYNKPKKELTYEHAGFLLALGLRGHLAKLRRTDIHMYLVQNHTATTVSILLGLAAARKGTMDEVVSKMLCLHIPSLLPPTISETTTKEATVQAAAILGVGLLYEGSNHRLMTEFLIEEMGRKPLNDRYADRESYSLSAGLALGLVTLGAGNYPEKRKALADLHLEDRLHRYMVGGSTTDKDPFEGVGSRAQAKASSDGDNKCSRIMEGPNVNTSVTAPGATLALGLMYLRSNNHAVATRLAIPDTHFLLDYVRPDLLMLREISKCLIMWDSVRPSTSWVESEVPRVISESMEALSSPPAAGKADVPIDFDVVGIKQSYANVVAGACFAMGLKFAGTAHRKAHETLLTELKRLKKLRESPSHPHRSDRSTLEMCLGCTALALGMVMAGTGELSTLRLFRELRATVEDDVYFGNHMALGMSIGLLFLAGGRATLGRSDESIAALVVSLFPRFPKTTVDNQYHCQAFRHLYVLAVEHRLVEAFDSETMEEIYAPVVVELRNGRMLRKYTPCIVPAFDEIVRVSSSSKRYWPVTCSGERLASVLGMGSLILKRRPGVLSYENDPLGYASILARGFPKKNFGRISISEFCERFNEDPVLQLYAEKELGGVPLMYRTLSASGDANIVRNTVILNHTVKMLPWATNSLPLQNLQLVLAYYDDAVNESGDEMLQRDFLEALRTRVAEYILGGPARPQRVFPG